jgi:hypothetical protein
MKRYILIIMALFALTACNSLKKTGTTGSKQNKYKSLKHFNNDTLLFVKNSIIERKSFYAGKELNVLIKDLQIPVKKYHNNHQ